MSDGLKEIIKNLVLFIIIIWIIITILLLVLLVLEKAENQRLTDEVEGYADMMGEIKSLSNDENTNSGDNELGEFGGYTY